MTAFNPADLTDALARAASQAASALSCAHLGRWWAVQARIEESEACLSEARALLCHPADLEGDPPAGMNGHGTLDPPIGG